MNCERRRAAWRRFLPVIVAWQILIALPPHLYPLEISAEFGSAGRPVEQIGPVEFQGIVRNQIQTLRDLGTQGLDQLRLIAVSPDSPEPKLAAAQLSARTIVALIRAGRAAVVVKDLGQRDRLGGYLGKANIEALAAIVPGMPADSRLELDQSADVSAVAASLDRFFDHVQTGALADFIPSGEYQEIWTRGVKGHVRGAPVAILRSPLGKPARFFSSFDGPLRPLTAHEILQVKTALTNYSNKNPSDANNPEYARFASYLSGALAAGKEGNSGSLRARLGRFLLAKDGLFSAVAMIGSLALNYCTNVYTQKWGEGLSKSSDLLLKHLPVINTSALFSWSFGLFLVWAALAAVWKEREKFSHLLWSFALLLAVRSLFILLTPLGLPVGMMEFDHGWLYRNVGHFLTFKHDLFFSGHVSFPFLCFLIFQKKWTRYLSLAFSFLLAAVVLLGRYHYAIDVLGAYFITYAVYRLEALLSRRKID